MLPFFFAQVLMQLWIALQAAASDSVIRPNAYNIRLTEHHLSDVINRDILRPAQQKDNLPFALAKYVELPLNHADAKSEKFRGRYWVDDAFYVPGGPVFFVDNGEATAEGMEEYLRTGASGSLAKQYGGLLILWEHRFYGTSMPDMTAAMKFTPDQRSSYLKFHTIEQAMEDIVVFARRFTYGNESMSPGDVPWVFLGGSYPGARAAWMRARNPAIFHAGLASSAVVQLQKNMWQYYRVIEETLDKAGYTNCSADIRNVSAWVDQVFDNKDGAAVDEFLAKVTGPQDSDLWNFFHFDDSPDPAEEWNNRRLNVRAAIAVMFRDFQYVGMRGLLGSFCDGLQYFSDKSKKANYRTAKSIFSRLGTQDALNIYASVLAALWPKVLKPEDYPPAGVRIEDLYNIDCSKRQLDCKNAITQLSWMWQVCTEFGAYQVANTTRPTNLLPKFESIENKLLDCKTWFGDTVSKGPNLDPINSRYGGWNMNPSNVFWTDGEIDPWRSLTPNSIEDNAPKRPSTTNIPQSGNTPGGDTFFGYVVEGGAHCSDLGQYVGTGLDTNGDYQRQKSLGGYVPGADVAHKLFKGALNVWLPAFRKHSIPNVSTYEQNLPGGGNGGGPSQGTGGSGGGGSTGSNNATHNSAVAFSEQSLSWMYWGLVPIVILLS